MKLFLNFSKTLRILIITVITVCAVLLITGLIVIWFIYPFEKPLPFITGLAVGCVQSAIKAAMLDKALNRSIDMEKNKAETYARLQAFARYVMTIAVFAAVLLFPDIFGLFGAIIGVLSLQFAAYITNIIAKN